MSNLQKPEYEKSGLLTGFFVIAVLIISFLLGGIPGLVTTIVGVGGIIVLTGTIWFAAGYTLGGPVFQYFFIKRRHESRLRQYHLLTYESDYFLVEPSFPKSLRWRFAQTFSVFVLFASTIAYMFPLAGQRSPIDETIPFVYAGLTALLVAMPLVTLLWLFEDSGLRNHRKDNNTIIKVGTLFEQVLFGGGAASAFLRLITSLNAPPAEVVGWALAIFVLFPPICFVLTLMHHELSQLELINRVLSVASTNSFPRRDIHLDNRHD